jgi:GNAT superfamily N-acetyltransferase
VLHRVKATEGPSEIDVRRAAPSELDVLCAAFPGRPRLLHEERLLQQEEGHGPYLIAWFEGEAVGHIQLQLPDERDLDPMLEGRGAAWAEDLWVTPSARGRWIGPALMRVLESEARRSGVARIVFFAGVDRGYAAARAIYGWMGWRERRPEPFIESAALPRDDRGSDHYVELVTMWEKDLTLPPGRPVRGSIEAPFDRPRSDDPPDPGPAPSQRRSVGEEAREPADPVREEESCLAGSETSSG